MRLNILFLDKYQSEPILSIKKWGWIDYFLISTNLDSDYSYYTEVFLVNIQIILGPVIDWDYGQLVTSLLVVHLTVYTKVCFGGISKVIHFLIVYTHRSPYGFDSICWGHFVAFYCEIFMKIHAQVYACMVVLFFLLYWC